MKYFLDTEFNGFQGQLLSMALVPEDSSKPEFYKELVFSNEELDPWVRDNVVPHLTETPVSRHEFQQALANYLWNAGECVIVADWPDDIRYFCEYLITGPGMSINILNKIHFTLDTSINYNSKIPHNALWDARAIRDYYASLEKK